ncbi:N-acetylglucosamine-6-phosphate deacetylase [Paraliobacillus sp. PM-2]|uniref:N-acetylglucosamine-6-phosphate deacetylase n=1 Tax=Paraliobacillus sp. PM-2 TaxID=1462524 RepID=UPI00061C9000|nr:N-acetylglucosamine-6-phosphate deacetylase [Paraliobacillus sp. PM-2]CQR47136.1 N-acetylglucosamine-6-phosphate deacetylase [Paraliobacillus sp. PM-2]
MSYYILADRFLLEDGEKKGGYLKVENGKFDDFIDTVPEGSEIEDWSGYTIAPGLFDTHIHGVNGYDIMDGTVEAVQAISASILEQGVTRFLPTTLTSSTSDIEQAIKAITEADEQALPGAQSEGIFLEGPYFTEKHKGAQNPDHFKTPDLKEFQEWQKIAKDSIVKIALAPEREHTMQFIKDVTGTGVQVSIAHTDASYDCCKQAVSEGANNYVHLFNGMSGLHHREPGVVGAALTDNNVYAELICDGHHVHPDIATLASEIKKEKLILITDCMRAGLMPDGEYQLGEFKVVMKDGIAKTEFGSLAGSTLQLINGVKNLQKWSGKPLYEIWHKGSLSPALSLGKDTRLGSISKGKVADYVVLDQSLDVHATAVEGTIKFKK